MANTRSAEKRNRQAQKRRARNVQVRSTVKDAVKSARTAIAGKDGSVTTTALREASRQLSKASSKGVMTKRAVSRRISRLAKAAHRASAAK